MELFKFNALNNLNNNYWKKLCKIRCVLNWKWTCHCCNIRHWKKSWKHRRSNQFFRNFVTMNSDTDSINFYTKYVFTYWKEAKMELKVSIWLYLMFFLTEQEHVSYSKYIRNMSGYQRISNIFIQQAEENDCVVPWKSKEFDEYTELKDQVIRMSKLGFNRHFLTSRTTTLAWQCFVRTGKWT